ncbi:MAG: CCA tRNA nucleotidyltransferase [Alphaproteobacteria bacterium]|nr:MAG: CCA tRNA nucleotidyltransferase [Alphaproteobacteria bacterium]
MTAPTINLPSEMNNDSITAVLRALTADGQIVRFVGGCVRDAILNRPLADIDLATPDVPQKVIELLQRAHIKFVPTGIDHGTITAISGAKAYQVTTLRRDIETDGRHATVTFTDNWAEDAARRDFTMNAIYCDGAGHLFDPLGAGIEDARAGRVRFVGNAADRIGEDYLRILRFFRFYAHYGQMDLNRSELEACRSAAAHLQRLSAERVRDEFLKLLAARQAARILQLMLDYDVLPQIISAAQFAMINSLAGLEMHSDAVRRLAALMIENHLNADDLAARFKLSNEQKERLEFLQRGFAARTTPTPQEWQKIIYYAGQSRAVDLAYLWAAEGLWEDYKFAENLQLALQWQDRRLPVGGEDLIALGIPQGPKLGEYLAAVESWWVEGNFSAGREQCLAHLRQLAGLA